MKPESYPFLKIARNYGYDYGDVLMCAQAIRDGQPLPTIWDRRTIAVHRIDEAVGQQKAIRFGYIDWLTGESLHHYDNGAPMFTPDGTMLDANGNRSIFDDVDAGSRNSYLLGGYFGFG